MTETLSYQHAVNTIKLLYEKIGYKLPNKTNLLQPINSQ